MSEKIPPSLLSSATALEAQYTTGVLETMLTLFERFIPLGFDASAVARALDETAETLTREYGPVAGQPARVAAARIRGWAKVDAVVKATSLHLNPDRPMMGNA